MAETNSMGRVVGYWISTALVIFALGAGGAADAMRIQPVVEGMAELGYPLYFCVILGVWKMLGAVAIAAPRTPRLKEWAYAGAIFDFTGAALSHWCASDDAAKLIAPIVLTILTVVSWSLRPASRRLPGPLV